MLHDGSRALLLLLSIALYPAFAGAEIIRMVPDPVNTGEPWRGQKVDVSFMEVTLLAGETLPGGGSVLRFAFEALWLEERSLETPIISVAPEENILSRTLENSNPEGFWSIGATPYGSIGIIPNLTPGWADELMENPRGELIYELSIVPSTGLLAGCDVCAGVLVEFVVPEPSPAVLLMLCLVPLILSGALRLR